MTVLGELTLEEAAREAAGNWRRFDSFVWFRDDQISDPEDWAIVYTSNRDSGLLAMSNASVIAKAMRPFTEGDNPDVVMESHSHWVVGHVDGFSVRVYRDGEITDAFKAYYGLTVQMDGYPILDEKDYGRREYEATIESITDAAWRLKTEYELPEGWEYEVYSWLSEYRSRAVENRDDQGGYPEEADLRAAFEALGYERLG